MKHLTLILAIALLASCAKEDRVIRYDATCDYCSFYYIGEGGEQGFVTLKGYWITDTIQLTDTTYRIDSTRFTRSWTSTVSIPHDADPYIEGCDHSILGPSTIKMQGNSRTFDVGCVKIEP